MTWTSMRLAAILCLFVAAHCAGGQDATPQNVSDGDGGAPAHSIGAATMDDDGTIIMTLRAEGPDGTIGDVQLRYPQGHQRYQSILDHLEGLEPGESKPVPPWTE